MKKNHWLNLTDEQLDWCDRATALGFELRFWHINGRAGASVNLGTALRDTVGNTKRSYLAGYASSSEETLSEAVASIAQSSEKAFQEVERLVAGRTTKAPETETP